jgi:hypothetical protein
MDEGDYRTFKKDMKKGKAKYICLSLASEKENLIFPENGIYRVRIEIEKVKA